MHSFAGDDPIVCRDHVRQLLGLEPFRPNGHSNDQANGKGHVHKAPESQHDLAKMLPAPPSGKCIPWQSTELRRHVYLTADGLEVKVKIKRAGGGYTQWFNINGSWQNGKPKDSAFPTIPYITWEINQLDPELADDEIYWPEGEKDVDTLGKLNLPAFTFGGVSDPLPDDLSMFADKRIVVLADNDDVGLKHARKKVELATGVAAAIKVVSFEQKDVSDFFDAGNTVEDLRQRVDAVPWNDCATTELTNADRHGAKVAPDIKFPLTAFRDIRVNTVRRGYLVKGIIASTGLTVIWGPPKCYKSFWTTDIGLHIALGWAYRGHRVVQAVVVYIALEGQFGFPARVEAFRKHHGIDPDIEVPFHLMTVSLNLIEDAKRLIADLSIQLRGAYPGIVFIDTLNRSLVGSESKDEDMSAYLSAAESIGHAFSCAVAIVHHCGVDATRPRGHTSQTGSAESQIAVKRLAKLSVGIKIEHAKDFEDGTEIVSRLEVVDTGLADPDGDPITSLIVLPVDGLSMPIPTTKKKLSPQNRIALDTLREAIAECGTAAKTSRAPHSAITTTFDDWLRYYDARTPGDIEPASKRRALQRARDSLQSGGIIAVWRDEIWIA